MGKFNFRPIAAFFSTIFTLLFCTFNNTKATEHFTVLAKIKPVISQRSFNQLTKKYIKIRDIRTDTLYMAKLESLLNTTYERFYPSVWSYVKIREITEPHFILVQAGTIIQRGKDKKTIKQFVKSFDGKIEIPLELAINAVEKAIQNNSQRYKNQSKQNYKNKIYFNLNPGTEFLYDPKDMAAKNIFVVQNLSFGKLDENNRLYTLGMEITQELSKIGLNPKNNNFAPYINLANLEGKNCKIINKLKELSKNKKSGISKIFNSLSRTKNQQNYNNYFDKIIISNGSLKGSKAIHAINIK